MRSASAAAAALGIALAACGGGSSPSSSSAPPPSGANVVALTVNGSLCSVSYANKPCVAVTVCAPGTSTCQTISDILLDTGSYGLRVFKNARDVNGQLFSVPLPQATAGSGALAECVQYGDGSQHWGPVQLASVVLGGEPPVQAPVQVVDATYASLPSGCSSPDRSPSDAGFNGVLGVGPFAEDCGPGCASRPDNGLYFQCNGTTCSGTTVALADQVQNPVALVPGDGNGVVIDLPSVPLGGVPSLQGALEIGIGTRSALPQGVTTYPLNGFGEFVTTFEGNTYTHSFVDTGSNGLFFPAPAGNVLPACASPASGWYCPPSVVSLSATNSPGAGGGAPGPAVPFQIGNFLGLIRSSNAVFVEVGGDAAGMGGFDWGLPFHFGRRVYVGLEGRSSPLGTGPYVAY